MKVKTSLSLEKSTIDRVKIAAEKEDRSSSYVMEKIIDAVLEAAETTENLADAIKKVSEELKKQGKEKIKKARGEK